MVRIGREVICESGEGRHFGGDEGHQRSDRLAAFKRT